MRLKLFGAAALALLLSSGNSAAPQGSAEGLRYVRYAGPQPRGARAAVKRLPVKIERHAHGAAVVFGVPFPVGALRSPDHVRVLDAAGREVPSQINEVSTWEPADPSLKWIWVFLFAGARDTYTLEFGDSVRRMRQPAPHVSVINNQRPGGYVRVDTGPMRFEVRKGAGGFISRIQVDRDKNGFDDGDLVADAADRGSFVDIIGDEGLDESKAVVERMAVERGSGPLHTIIRVDGHYEYSRKDHPSAPFVLRIHAYAGRTSLRVDHTFIFTGDPDRHVKQQGQHAHIATGLGQVIEEKGNDPGWMQPRDRLAAAGLSVSLASPAAGVRNDAVTGTASIAQGRWWETGAPTPVRFDGAASGAWSLLQTGPKPNRIPPVPESTPTTRLEGFSATASVGERRVASADRADGWMSVARGTARVSIGIPRFLEEYPKEIHYDPATSRLTAFFWSPRVEPMSFARFSSDLDREEETVAIENTAQGMAKTSEAVIDFASEGTGAETIPMASFLTPAVGHVDPDWYGASGVFGRFAAQGSAFADLDRAYDYKFDWMLFNQKWVPWYGMWDYGDWRLYFDGAKWTNWGNNEPSQDFMCWLQFMRTGDARVFDAARATSRHTMDVDNIHWPSDPVYIGDSNVSRDYWEFLKRPAGTPYLGIGSRHANQHWVRTLGAHVWVTGWLADFYLAADHRGLDMAIQTADMHLKRIWGEHGLTGRRLYLATWNVMETWDATKDPKYRREIEDYLARILRLQDHEQGGSLSMERYGYADVYITHAFAKFMSLTPPAEHALVRSALVRHARRVRDVPALNHEFESYMSGVYALALGWDLTGEPSLLVEMRRRVDVLKTDALPRSADDRGWTQASLFQALDKATHLPRNGVRQGARAMPIWSATNGLRVFGWTHAYTLPYAIERLSRARADAAQSSR
ncbi:MAG: hypothetical protein ABIP65_01865 [Vicinamibacterales bacterium]